MSNPFNFGRIGPVDDVPADDAALRAEMLEPRLVERPVPPPPLRVPRSAQGRYSYADLSAAARMLAVLRQGTEHRPPPPSPADRVLDIVADRLLDLF